MISATAASIQSLWSAALASIIVISIVDDGHVRLATMKWILQGIT